MSNSFLKKLSVYIPLWQRRIPKYPLYVDGNPQLRVFMPLFWMKMLRPERKTPPDTLEFETHPQMTKADIKNYLEKIYGVQVLTVRSQLTKGDEIKTFGGADVGRESPKRIARVQVNEKFEFPDLFSHRMTEEAKAVKDFEKIKKETDKIAKQTWDKLDVPKWFR